MITSQPTDRIAETSVQKKQFDDPTVFAEHSLLACTLFNTTCLAAVGESIEPYHFDNRLHGDLYQVARQCWKDRREPVSVSALMRVFDADGCEKHDIAPTEFILKLKSLSGALNSPAEACEAAKSVLQGAFLRNKIRLLQASPEQMRELADDHIQRMSQLTSAAPNPDELLLFGSQLEGHSSSQYLWKGIINQGTIAALHGPSGAGKTFYALHLGAHVATGKSFSSRRVKPAAVLYCALEGQSDFPKRVQAVSQLLGDAGKNFALLRPSINLGVDAANDASEANLVRAIKAHLAASGQPSLLLVVDTLARAIAGDNENDAQAMSGMLARLDRIRAKTGAAVLLIHHPGKDASLGMRGSSALYAAMDTVIRIERDKNDDERRVTIEKSKDGSEGPLSSYQLDTVVLGHDDDGDEITSCVVRLVDGVGHRKSRRPAEGSSAAKALNELEHLIIEGAFEVLANHSRAPKGTKAVAKSMWRAVCRTKGLSDTGEAEAEKKAFSRALQLLEKTN